MGGGETAPPPVSNPAKDISKYTSALEGVMPQLLSLEGSSRPQFGALNLADIGGALGGTGGQTGLIGLGGQATQGAQSQLEAARQAELGSMAGNTGTVRGILAGLSPGSAELMANQTGMANAAYSRAQGLNPQEARMADQSAREAFGARGRLNDTASVAGELLSREDVMAKKRQEASQLGGQAFAQEQQFASPAMSLLGGTPQSVLLGQDYLNAGRQAVGANTPQLIDTGAGINLGQQQASNLASWQQSNASAANAQNSQYAQIASALAMAAMSYSDERLKTKKRKTGDKVSGLPVYEYEYKGHPTKFKGVMAQDVAKKKPSAVDLLGGTMRVDYSKL